MEACSEVVEACKLHSFKKRDEDMVEVKLLAMARPLLQATKMVALTTWDAFVKE